MTLDLNADLKGNLGVNLEADISLDLDGEIDVNFKANLGMIRRSDFNAD